MASGRIHVSLGGTAAGLSRLAAGADMRLTPARCEMHALLGRRLPMGMLPEWSLTDRIRHGREFLVRITRQDFGYDAMKWHDYLWETDAGGYRWARRNREKWASEVEMAVGDPVWQRAVRELEATA